MNLAEMKTAVETALKAVGLEKPVTTEDEQVVVDNVVTLGPADDGWRVAWWRALPATHEDAPDWVDETLYDGPSFYDAARKAALAFHEEALAWCFCADGD